MSAVIAEVASRRYLSTRLRALPEYEQARLLRVAQELRARRLTYTAIATVLGLYEALDVTEGMVRYWLHQNGDPVNELKSIRTRAQVAAGVGRWAR